MSDWQTIAEFGPFDAVLANSVLCRHPEGLTASVLDALPFAQWDELVAGLVENLAADGLLQVVNSNYRITLASAAERLEPIELPGVQHSGFVPRFLRSGHKAIHIERRRLDDGLDFWLAPSADIDLRTELAPMLYCRRGNELEAIVNLVGAPFRALRAVGPVASRRHEPGRDTRPSTSSVADSTTVSTSGLPLLPISTFEPNSRRCSIAVAETSWRRSSIWWVLRSVRCVRLARWRVVDMSPTATARTELWRARWNDGSRPRVPPKFPMRSTSLMSCW